MAGTKTKQQLMGEIEDLQAQLAEAQETLRAIREGEVDAIVVSGTRGEQVFSLVGAESVYRLIVETMKEAALTVTFDGRILFCNAQFGAFVGLPLEQIVGHTLQEFVAPEHRNATGALLITSQKEPVKQKLVFQNAEGAPVPAHVSSNVINQPDGLSICIVAADLTELENSTAMLQQLRRQQEALRESEERYRLVNQATNDAIWDLNLTDGTIRWNETYSRMFGRPPETACSWQWWIDHIHPGDRERTTGGLRSAIDGHETIWTCEYRFLRADGAWAHIYDRAYIARTETGKASRVIGAMADLMERKRAEEALRQSESLLRTITDTTEDAIYVKDRNSRLLMVNPATLRLLGKPVEQIVGHTDAEFYDDPVVSAAILENDRHLIDSGTAQVFEETIETTAGRRIMLSSKVPSRDAEGNIVGIIGISRDITERKRVEEELRQSEQNYRMLTESERAARSEAEQANRIKDEFLANLSHELRGPLNPILGWTQILQKGGFDEKTLRQGLDVIERNTRRQAQLISNLLDMSGIISGKLRLDVRSCDVSAVLEGAIESVTPSAQAKSIRIERILNPSVPILGDPSRLQQVFWNILSNAVKFTPVGGRVQISARRINSHVEVTISDTGHGIKPDFLPYIFERFRQADSSAMKKQGGLGLGLAITKHLVELHGGTVAAESPGEGKGATFRVVLPIMAIHLEAGELPAAAGALAPDTVDLTGLKVLIVDDEADTRLVVTRLLGECGADVIGAASAAEAMSILQARKPDVLIGDIGMPEMDGYQMIRQIRSLPVEDGGEIPAIALTAFSRVEDRRRALLAGYQYHLAKPVEVSELTATLAMITKRVPRP